MPRAISAGGPSQQGTPTTQDRPRRTDQGAQDLPLEWGLGAGWEGHGQKDDSATLQGAPPPSVGLWGVGGGLLPNVIKWKIFQQGKKLGILLGNC